MSPTVNSIGEAVRQAMIYVYTKTFDLILTAWAWNIRRKKEAGESTTMFHDMTTAAMTTPMLYNYTSTPLPGDDGGSLEAHKVIYVMCFFVIPIILIVALISNILILVVLPRTKIPPTFLICLTALTVSDLLASAFGLAHAVLYAYVYEAEVPAGRWDKLAFLTNCLYLLFYLFLCYSAGVVITIVAIRHRLVSNPLSLRKITPRTVAIFCVFVFLGTVILTLLAFGFAVWWQCYDEESSAPCLGMHQSSGMDSFLSGAGYYVSLLTIVYGPFLIVVNLICLFSVHRSLKRREKLVNDMTSTGSDSLKKGKANSNSTSSVKSKKRRQKTSRVTRVLMIILAVDSILAIPSSAEAIALLIMPDGNIFHRSTLQFRIFDNVTRLCCALRLLYKFYLYSTTHKEFKAAVLVALSCVTEKIKTITPPPSSKTDSTEPVVVASGNITTINVTLDEDSSNASSSTSGLRL